MKTTNNDSEKRTSSRKLLFSAYHLIVMFGAFIGYHYLFNLVVWLQDRYSNVYSRTYAAMLIILSPVLFYFFIKWMTGKVRAGYVLYQGILAFTVLAFFLHRNSVWIAVPALLFLIIYGVAFLNEEKNRRPFRNKPRIPVKEKPQPGTALKNPLYKKNVASFMEGLNAKAFHEQRRVIPKREREKEEEPPFTIQCLRMLYHLLNITGFNYAFVLWIQIADGLELRYAEIAVFFITLAYPALLFLALRWFAKELLPHGIVICCLISLCAFLLLLENQTGVLYLLYPTACFFVAVIVSAFKSEKLRKVRVTRGADPIYEDEEQALARDAKRQILRKHKSKRENVKWYTHPWYRKKSIN